MKIDFHAVTALRIVLAGLFALLVLFQTMSLPGQFAHMAQENPSYAYLRWPLTIVTIFWALCAQVVIVSTWKLLALVLSDRIFSEASRVWVDAMVRAIAAGWVSLVAVTAWATLTADDPGGPMLLILLTVGVSAAGLLMSVMRSLLHRAIDLRTDLEAVI